MLKNATPAGLMFDKVYLFGSYANVHAHEWSDIDLLLVSKRFTTNTFDNLKLYLSINAKYPAVEIHAYPTDYFMKGDAFLQDILKSAVEIV